uniref:Uncharacterized protein n=1 Tax=Tanacetum cinerariifolium TaxID=118510 RepID=A0A699HII3_TANCI|nr:hypothetical protein [Tanacetum cinerariifolium]
MAFIHKFCLLLFAWILVVKKIVQADIDADAEITLVDETTEDQGRFDDQEMFDTHVLNDEEIFAESVDIAKQAKEIVVDKDLIDDITLVKALMKIKSTKPKADKVVIQEQELDTATTTTVVTVAGTRPKAKSIVMQEPNETPTTTTVTNIFKSSRQIKRRLQDEIDEQDMLAKEKAQLIEDENLALDNVQAIKDTNYELAARLQEEEQGELTIEEKSRLFVELMDKRKKHFEKLRAEGHRRKPLTKAQKRNQMLVKDKAVLTQESSSKRARDELDQQKSKKQKMEDDKEYEELKRCLKIIPDDEDDVTIDAKPLSIKTPIIDYKIYKEGKKVTSKFSEQMEIHRCI